MSNNIDYIKIMDETKIRQMIFQGPPGTSKTYSAKKLICSSVDNDLSANTLSTQDEITLSNTQISDYNILFEAFNAPQKQNNEIDNSNLKEIIKYKVAWDIVQLHPSYTYEDFVRGISVETVEGKVNYYTENKILGKIASLASAAKQFDSEIKFFLIIDEINRANMASVFGELIYALEYRNNEITTPYTLSNDARVSSFERDLGRKINLPENLYIIGTMNTADRSIANLDYAIRRRFIFHSLYPDKEILNSMLKLNDEERKIVLDYFDKISLLFTDATEVKKEDEVRVHLTNQHKKKDIQIGHTYFMVKSKKEFDYKFEYQIKPLLQEYDSAGYFEWKDGNTLETYLSNM